MTKRISKTLAFCALNSITPCHATDYVWSGVGKDGLWTTPTNWQPNTGFPRSGDTVVLPPITANVTINLNGDQAVRSVTFNPVSLASYTLTTALLADLLSQFPFLSAWTARPEPWLRLSNH